MIGGIPRKEGKENSQKEAFLNAAELILESLKRGERVESQAAFDRLVTRRSEFSQLFAEKEEQFSALIALTDLALRDTRESGGWDYLAEAQDLIEEIRGAR